MPDEQTIKRLNRNIKLFGVYKVFTKRVFIPLITIYATQQAGLNIQQIGITSMAASIVSLLFDTTTGFWADTYGRKRSAQVGAALAVVASLLYVLSNDFTGILSASLVLAAGYSFMNGSMDALVHDSLVVLKRVDDYARIASRAQAFALIANAALVTLIPMLYPIDKRLPFVAGMVAYGVLFCLSSLLEEPKIHHDATQEERKFIRTVRMLVNRRTILFFVMAGLAYSAATGTVDVFNLAQLELGLSVKYLGLIYGISSLVGAALGFVVHRLKKLSFRTYVSIDFFTTFTLFIGYGVIRWLPLALFTFFLNFSFWRYQQIMYQHYILGLYGTTRYKATIISLLTNFRSLNEVWLALASTTAAQHFGLLNTIGYGAVFMLLAWPVLLFSVTQFSAHIKAETAS